jgi:Flp pilus assembly protein TadG
MQTQTIHRNTRRPRRAKGAAIVEAAFVLPIVLIFIMGLFEYGRYYLMVHICYNAVSAGAAYACKHTSPIVISGTPTCGSDDSDVIGVVNANMGTQQLANPTPSVYLSDALGNPTLDSAGNPIRFIYASVGQYITVKLTGTYTFIPATMLGLPSTRTETFTTVRRSEAN